MNKTEVYSWRLSPRTKEELERAARQENLSVGSLLDSIVGEWMRAEKSVNGADENQQKQLHAAAARTIGVLHGGNPRRSEQARQALRARLVKRNARPRPN
jgi:hypothetical protein